MCLDFQHPEPLTTGYVDGIFWHLINIQLKLQSHLKVQRMRSTAIGNVGIYSVEELLHFLCALHKTGSFVKWMENKVEEWRTEQKTVASDIFTDDCPLWNGVGLFNPNKLPLSYWQNSSSAITLSIGGLPPHGDWDGWKGIHQSATHHFGAQKSICDSAWHDPKEYWEDQATPEQQCGDSLLICRYSELLNCSAGSRQSLPQFMWLSRWGSWLETVLATLLV